MTKNRLISGRTVVVIVTALTLVLLVGSAILQRLVFKADQLSAAVLLTAATTVSGDNQPIDLKIQVDLAAPSAVLAVEVGISYDPDLIEVVTLVPANSWQGKKLIDGNGHLRWLVVPSEDQGPAVSLSNLVTFGTLTVKAVKSGGATLKLIPAETIVSSYNPAEGNQVSNIVASVQDVRLTISDRVVAAATPPGKTTGLVLDDARTETPIPPPGATGLGLQRLIGANVFSYPNSAVVFVATRYQATVAVEFGETPELSNSVESTDSSSHQSVRLVALKSRTRYYYRVTLVNPERNSRVVGSLRSFVTSTASTAAVDPSQSDLQLVAPTGRNTTTAVIIIRDQNGNVVVNQTPTIEVTSGQASLATSVSSNGQYQFAITSDLTRRQVVRVRATLSNQLIGEQRLVFDPTYTDPKIPTSDQPVRLPLTSPTLILVAGLAILSALLIALFARLARLK